MYQLKIPTKTLLTSKVRVHGNATIQTLPYVTNSLYYF